MTYLRHVVREIGAKPPPCPPCESGRISGSVSKVLDAVIRAHLQAIRAPRCREPGSQTSNATGTGDQLSP